MMAATSTSTATSCSKFSLVMVAITCRHGHPSCRNGLNSGDTPVLVRKICYTNIIKATKSKPTDSN